MKKRASSFGGYILLAIAAAGLLGINVKGFGERLHRSSLETDGVIVQGRVEDHLLARCSGFRCSERTTFAGEIGSERYNDFLDSCGSGRRYRCHTDLIVHFRHAGQQKQLVGQVARSDFEHLVDGSTVAVLVDADDPSGSVLRDYEPEGFLFYVAILVDVVVAFVGTVIFGSSRGSKKHVGYARY